MSRVCQYCHTACSNETKFCPNCGSKLPAPNTQAHCMYEDNSHPHSTMGPEIPDRPYRWNQDSHPHSTVNTVSAWENSGKKTSYNVTTEQSMKWYKFLTSVVLFVTAVANIINGCRALSGAIYGESAGIVYNLLPSILTIDRIFGVAAIVLGIRALLVRSQLAKFQQTGPKAFYSLIILSIVIEVVYTAAIMSLLQSYSILFGEMLTGNLLEITFRVVGSIIYLVLNKIYFDKRMHLFVNP